MRLTETYSPLSCTAAPHEEPTAPCDEPAPCGKLATCTDEPALAETCGDEPAEACGDEPAEPAETCGDAPAETCGDQPALHDRF